MNAATALIDIVGQEKMRERIINRSSPVPFTGCWIWEGRTGNSGYGSTTFVRALREVMAHRGAYAAWHGPIPDGMCVLHSCDVRCCVNPAHLSLGTKKQNSEQMVQRGRHVSPPTRRTACPRGHEYSGLNARGARICRICNLAATKRWNLKHRKAS